MNGRHGPQPHCRLQVVFERPPRNQPPPDLADMVKTASLLSPYLDRVPPPPIPTFPDDDLDMILTDGTKPLPLDATTYEQRRASIAQLKNVMAWMLSTPGLANC